LKKFVFILMFLVFGISFAQKVMEREFNASEISTLEIISSTIYTIKITSEKTKKIKIITQIEGENYENVVLSIIEKEGGLKIETPYSLFFKPENDKLAAHKVISIEMELIVPETVQVNIVAPIASLTSQGKFKSISALLGSGNCVLKDFKGDALLKTKEGFIKVYCSEKTFGKAFSKKGKIINELSKKESKYRIEAESIEGNISLYQIH